MSLTGANTTPLGRLHPILAAKQQGPVSPTPGFKRDAGNSDFGGKSFRYNNSLSHKNSMCAGVFIFDL